jgi:hypothetical protein
MGVLDDAIREHLELKRRRGASEEELTRKEAEALGPVRRVASEEAAGPVLDPQSLEEARDEEPAAAHDFEAYGPSERLLDEDVDPYLDVGGETAARQGVLDDSDPYADAFADHVGVESRDAGRRPDPGATGSIGDKPDEPTSARPPGTRGETPADDLRVDADPAGHAGDPSVAPDHPLSADDPPPDQPSAAPAAPARPEPAGRRSRLARAGEALGLGRRAEAEVGEIEEPGPSVPPRGPGASRPLNEERPPVAPSAPPVDAAFGPVPPAPAVPPAQAAALHPAEEAGGEPEREHESRRAPDPGLAAAGEGVEDPDVLEETPDFLQETPEHDRLWFEQKAPRDFDFDD